MRRSSSGASHASLPRGGQGGGDDTTAGNGGHGVLGGATAGAGTVEDGSSPLLAASTPQSGRQLHVVSPGDDNEDADLLKAGALRGYASPPTRRMNAFMVTLTGMCAIGGLLFGWDTGVVSAAVLVLRDDYSMTDLQVEVCSMAGVQWLRRWYGWGGGVAAPLRRAHKCSLRLAARTHSSWSARQLLPQSSARPWVLA